LNLLQKIITDSNTKAMVFQLFIIELCRSIQYLNFAAGGRNFIAGLTFRGNSPRGA
jgi:hypothetical protein